MEQPCPVQPDAQIGGRYSVRRPLGRAAGCELFDGVQLFTHRAVTLKTAKRSTEADRLLTEARALAQVSHPVLPSVLDALIGPDDQVCVVFEHVRGRSLEGLLTARGRLDADEALHWFRSLADAVGTLHAAGWVGVTPGVSSILLAEGAHQRPVLLDLGPRLRRGAAAEVADDVRHLGALLAEMLERRPTLADELPRSMAALVGQATAARFGDVSALLDALSVVDPSSARVPVARPSQRRHRRAGLVAPARLLLPHASLDVRTEDVSESGVQVLSATSLPVGCTVTLRMPLPLTGRITGLPCVVRWVRSRADAAGPFAVGLEFLDADARAHREVVDYVDALGGEAAGR